MIGIHQIHDLGLVFAGVLYGPNLSANQIAQFLIIIYGKNHMTILADFLHDGVP